MNKSETLNDGTRLHANFLPMDGEFTIAINWKCISNDLRCSVGVLQPTLGRVCKIDVKNDKGGRTAAAEHKNYHKDLQRRISEIIFPSSQLMYEALSHVIGETLNSRCHGDKKLIGRLRHGRILPRSKPPRTAKSYLPFQPWKKKFSLYS